MVTTSLLWTMTLLPLLRLASSQIILREGRHVCVEESTEMLSVTSRKSYCRAFYQLSHRPCKNGQLADSTGLCPYFRVGYRRAMKDVVERVPRTNRVFTCCPGWSGYSARHNACTTPVCEGGCGRGDCRLPGKCSCPPGTKGPNCAEAASDSGCDARLHGCEHGCAVEGGAVVCTCQEGFSLGLDQKSCRFCLSCTKEFQELKERQTAMEEKIVSIDHNFNRLQADMASMSAGLRNLTSLVAGYRDDVTGQTTPPGDGEFLGAADVFSILESMETDLASVEARLGQCGCGQDELKWREDDEDHVAVKTPPKAVTSSRRPMTSPRDDATTKRATTTTEEPFFTLPNILA